MKANRVSFWVPYARVASVLVATACAASVPTELVEPPVGVHIEITPKTLRFSAIGGEEQLRVVVRDGVGKAIWNPQVTWRVLDAPVVEVVGDGWITPRSNGTTRVAATFHGSERVTSDTATVVVRQVVTAVYGIPPRRGLHVGDSFPFEVIAHDARGSPVQDVSVSWGSDASGTVSVDRDGRATAGAVGTTHLTASVNTFAGSQILSARILVGVIRSADYVQVRAGAHHTCGLLRSGEVYCWGLDDLERLSDDMGLSGSVPTRVAGGPALFSIDAGGFHTCGISSDGQGFCWGGNLFGQLGNGSGGYETDRRDTPQLVSGGHRFRSITAGWTHTCALTLEGRAYCWGSNDMGELGLGTAGNGMRDLVPMPVLGDLVFRAISAGNRHTCALTEAGDAYCWGDHFLGKLGSPDADFGLDGNPVPLPAASGVAFRTIHAGGEHTCGMSVTDEVYCWGGWIDVLSDWEVTSRTRPTRIGQDLDFVSLAEGMERMCGVVRGGAVYCWEADDDKSPGKVPGSLSFVEVSTGVSRACGRSTDGRLYCWGNAADGLGDGRRTTSDVPVLVSAPFD